MKYILFICIFHFWSTLYSQTPQSNCSCCTSDYKAFDFWLGEWEVFNPQGKKVGSSSITSKQDSCIIQENWKSISTNTGTSYNYFDNATQLWHQIYIDNTGISLHLTGKWKQDTMILKSVKTLNSQSNSFIINQISWTKDQYGYVRQKWDILDTTGALIQTAFEGIYKPIISTQIVDSLRPIVVIDYVKILNNRKNEALFYYENNWKVFRDYALKSNAIKSYKLLEVESSKNSKYNLILMTEFENITTYNNSEVVFSQIMQEVRPNGQKLLNSIQPKDFRKVVFFENSRTLLDSIPK